MRDVVCLVLCTLCVTMLCVVSPPPTEIFGSIDLKSLKKDLIIPIHVNDTAYNNGVSLSFNLIKVEEDTDSKLFSLYGYDGSISYVGHKCVIYVDTQFNLSVSYNLSGCLDTNIVIELYPSSNMQDTLVNLYENVTYINFNKEYVDNANVDLPGTEVGWCEYNGTYILGTLKYTTGKAMVNDTLEGAMIECLNHADSACRGIVHTPSNPKGYQLRRGEIPITAPYYPQFPEVTYLKAPCVGPDQATVIDMNFILYKQNKTLILSHINVDELLSNGEVDHSKMYKRYELGNLVPGSYVDFTSIPYNLSEGMYEYHPKLSAKSWIVTAAQFTLNEGCLLQEASNEEDYIALNIGGQDSIKKSRYVWKAGNSGYSLDVKKYCMYENTDMKDKLTDVYITKEEARKACTSSKVCKGFTLSDDVFMPNSNITLGYQLAKGSLRTSSSSTTSTSWFKGYCVGGAIKGGIWCQYNNTITYDSVFTSKYVGSPSGYKGHHALQRTLDECHLRSDCMYVMSVWDEGMSEVKYMMTKWDGDPWTRRGNGTAWIQCGKNYTTINQWTNDGNLQLGKKNIATVFCYERTFPLEKSSITQLETGNSISSSSSSQRCQWIIQAVTNSINSYIALITFKSDTNASKFYFRDGSSAAITNAMLRHNRSSTAAYIYKFKLKANTDRIEVTPGAKECHIQLYRTDVCEPTEQNNNYGYYYLNRTTYHTAAESGTCEGDPDKAAKWECSSTGEWKYLNNCPFYQCYEEFGRRHDDSYVKYAASVPVIRVGTSNRGDCCNSTWLFECKENYSIDYRDCIKLKDCPAKTISIRVKESTTTGQDLILTITPSAMTAKKSKKVACPYGTGYITVSCDGCLKNTEIKSDSHNCGPKNCPMSKMFSDPKYGQVNITFPAKDYPVWGEKVTKECPYSKTGGQFIATCERGEIVGNYIGCDMAPQCEKGSTDMGGQQFGSISWPETHAMENVELGCKYGGSATRNCTWNGTWADPVSKCENRAYCETKLIKYRGVTFSVFTAKAGHISKTYCDHAMCDGWGVIYGRNPSQQCGYRLCDGDSGEFGQPNYEFCNFNCTASDNTNLTAGTKITKTCNRDNDDEGKQSWVCSGSGEWHANLTEGCLLKTCTDDKPAGCIPTNTAGSSEEELLAGLLTSVDRIDLTTDANKALVGNVVKALVPAKRNPSATSSDLMKIVDVVSKIANKLAETGGEIKTDTVTMYGIRLQTKKKRAVIKDETRGITGTGFTAGIGVSLYNSDAMFSSNATENEKKVAGDGKVMSITTPAGADNVTSISMDFVNTNGSKNASIFSCVYYDTVNFTWSSAGCNDHPDLEDGKLVCECTHLTSFAVLVSLSATNSQSQDIASAILLTISAVCLVLTLCAILPHKKIREKQIMKVHLNLTAALLLATIAFLVIEYGNSKPKVCYFVAFMVHWLWLAVFGWMVVEGVTLYRQTVQALQSYGRPVPWFVIKNFIAVYGGALIFPLLGVIIDETTNWEYISQPICFLSPKNTLIAFFLVPLYTVLVASIFFFVRVSCVIIQAKKQGNAGKDYWKKQLKAVISIAVVLGLAWIIAPFINLAQSSDTAKRILEWFFLIMCCLQGITVFLIQVVFSDDVKNSWLGTYKDSDFEKMTETVFEKSRKFKGSVRATLSSKIKAQAGEEVECNVSEYEDEADQNGDQTESEDNYINKDQMDEKAADNHDPVYDEAHVEVETTITDSERPEHDYVSPDDIKM